MQQQQTLGEFIQGKLAGSTLEQHTQPRSYDCDVVHADASITDDAIEGWIIEYYRLARIPFELKVHFGHVKIGDLNHSLSMSNIKRPRFMVKITVRLEH